MSLRASRAQIDGALTTIRRVLAAPGWILVAMAMVLAPGAGAAATGASCAYDLPAIASVEVQEIGAGGLRTAQLNDTPEGSAATSAVGRGTCTTYVAAKCCHKHGRRLR